MNGERLKRKLSAILSADVKGYRRMMNEDEASTIHFLKECRSLMTDLIQQYRGWSVDAPRDNLLAEFASAVDETECAVEIQKEHQNNLFNLGHALFYTSSGSNNFISRQPQISKRRNQWF